MVEDYLRACKHFIENHDWDNARDVKSFLDSLKKFLKVSSVLLRREKKMNFINFYLVLMN